MHDQPKEEWQIRWVAMVVIRECREQDLAACSAFTPSSDHGIP
jgi:hypothetical protein